MALPSSQVISIWVKETLISESWVLLHDACRDALKRRLKGWSVDQIDDLAEQNIQYVAEHLRNEMAICKEDGVPPTFEVDNEQSPYIRGASSEHQKLLEQIRAIDPFLFEKLCASILAKLGAKSDTTRRTNDGGVDFFAIDFDFVPDGLATPLTCRAAVVGQAKRYKDNNIVNETALRSFVGGAMRWRHTLASTGKIGPLSPVLFAFWTTSSFEPNAREYARAMGLWYMEGLTLAAYCAALDLKAEVAQMLEQTQQMKVAK